MSYTRDDVKRWMADVMARRGISAKSWAAKAKVAQSSITRIVADPAGSALTKPDTLTKLATAVQERVPFLGGIAPDYDYNLDPDLLRKANDLADEGLKELSAENAAACRLEVVRGAYSVLSRYRAHGRSIDDEAIDELASDLIRHIVSVTIELRSRTKSR